MSFSGANGTARPFTMRSWTCCFAGGLTSVTLRDLSWRNARRQARDYLVYFGHPIVIATALMYAFNGLVFSREIAELSAKLSSLPLVIVLASVAVVLILGWLVAYITRFMLTRRSRELGTYLLIGLEHRQVARLFFWKTWRWAARLCSWGWRRGICCFRH